MPNTPLSVGTYGDNVARLQDLLRQRGFQLPASEVNRTFFGPGTRQAVMQFQQQNGLPISGAVDEQTTSALSATSSTPFNAQPPQFTVSTASMTGASPRAGIAAPLLPEMMIPGNVGTPANNQSADAILYTVTGTVTSPDRAGVGNLLVQVVDKNVGPDVLLAETTTDNRGHYNALFTGQSLLNRNKTQPDLQARVYTGKTFLAASDVHYNATTNETLHVNLPANLMALPSEYETLTSTLAAHYTGPLGALQETSDRQDITYLANKTGWDARAVALAALADQFRTNTPPGAASAGVIRSEFYYALFRAGLPANTNTLYRTDLKTVSAVWTQAITQGIIPTSLQDDVPHALEAFQKLSAATLLDTIPLPNTSSQRALLQFTLGNDLQRQQQFAELYTQYQNDLPTFWATLQKTFGNTTTSRLQLDGQLAFLTLNNAQLMSNLYKAEQAAPLTSMLDLVRRGYYQAPKWKALMNGVSSGPIPGATPDEKQSNYIALLTAQLRLSYPTAVLAEMVNSGNVPLTADPNLRGGVYQFLVQNQGKYELGVEPLDQYLSENGLVGKVDPNVVLQIKRLQRVYQITQSDGAMNTLLAQNVESAYKIVHYGQEAFVRVFQDSMGGPDIAAQTFAKAQSVHHAVLNITVDYLSRRVAPQLGNGSITNIGPFPDNTNPASSSNSAASATLEKLFGSLDYCACDECRSILGPAAYLVDLLNFTDCQAPPVNSANPQTVLFARRPDLQNLLLTCDNTNVALPYIDLVNETLEYFVANGSLAGYPGYTTDGSVTSSAELIACPQNVNDAAYARLKLALFPPPLPFDRSLEILRLLFQKFDVSLQDAMVALRASDAIDRPTGPTAYGWRDILMEEIGLSREEYQILTDSTLTLQQLYGYSTAMTQAQTITALSNVQDYSRRLNATFDDLLSILQTHFINPYSTLIPQLETLGVPFSTLAALKNGTLGTQAFLDLLPTGPSAPNPDDFGGNIVAWITNPTRYAKIMGLITIANPTTPTDLCSMADFQFSYSNPDNTANTLLPIDFIRLLRFIRLWQKLGLTIQQTDNIIATLAPAIGTVTSLTELDTAFRTLLPRIGFAHRVLRQLSLSADTDLEKLLTCWGPIGVYGANSLYALMFLNPAIQRQDPVFAPDIDGTVLQDTTQTTVVSPINQKAVVGGTLTINDTLTTTINGAAIVYAVGASDTSPMALAGHVAAAINATTTTDPVTGQPLNKVISATSASGIVTFKAIGSGGNFTLACSVSPGATETYMPLDHAPALRAAFNMTESEFALITQALGFDSTTVLNLENISQIYRRSWLARELEISVFELLLLIQYSGLDPFAPPDPAPIPPAEPPVIRFIRLVQAMSTASLQPVQALYLLWNQDISGTSAPTIADVAALALILRTDFATVDAQFAIVDDPTGDNAKSLMTLVYGAATANFFFGLINNTVSVSVSYGGTVPQAVLDASKGRLTYDNLSKQLTYGGVLDPTTLNAINAAIVANPPLSTAIGQLLTASQAMVNPFFAQYPELLTPYTTYATSSDPVQTKHMTLLANLLPKIEPKRKVEQALADVTAAAGIDTSFAIALLSNPAVLHATTDTSTPAVADLTAIEAMGFSAQFYLTNDTTLPPDQSVDNVPSLSYAAGGTIMLPPGKGSSVIAGIWSGFLNCPQDGDYDLSITTDVGAMITLSIGNTAIAMTHSGNIWTNASVISLTAGQLTPIVLTATHLSATLSVSWHSSMLGWQPIPGQYLYSQTLVNRLSTTYTRFLKATSLAIALSLDANELVHLATDADYQVQGTNWINALTVSGNPDAPTSSGFYKVLDGILTFAQLKQALSPKDERLLSVLQNPAEATLANKKSVLLTLTGWEQVSLYTLLQHFFGSTALSVLTHVENLWRVYNAFVVVSTCSIGAASLLAAATNAPSAQIVNDFQSAVRARYAETDWLTVIKPINDAMRLLQRDALTPCVLQLCAEAGAVVDINTPVNTPDTLFEFLLMDVEMDCCMETSRIRHALSSVQLFIERCIRGLESNASDVTMNVDPTIFSASAWTWMKRYRVWEANREVFLWPENWLYPELRNDRSPFFKTIMSKLLQNDITDDAATSAYLEYLSDLEDVAKLELCAICYVPTTSSTSNATVHAIARTSGAKRTYYYRYYDSAAWGPWEQVPLTIEDNPLMLVQWNNRLLLFWLQVVQTPSQPSQTSTSGEDNGTSSKPLTDSKTTVGDLASGLNPSPSPEQTVVQLNLFWSEYYNRKWHPAKSSDTNNPVPFCTTAISGPSQFDRSQIKFRATMDPNDPQKRLWLSIFSGQGEATFCLYNTHSAPIVAVGNVAPLSSSLYLRNIDIQQMTNDPSGPVKLHAAYFYYPPGVDNNRDDVTFTEFDNDLVSTKISPVEAYMIELLNQILPDPLNWTTPFFFGDTRNVFYIQTTESTMILPDSPYYGVVGFVPPASIQAAPLTLKNPTLPGQAIPRVNPVNQLQTIATVNPAPIARYVTEDAYISRGLGTTGSVRYGNAVIGVSGAITSPPTSQSTPALQSKE